MFCCFVFVGARSSKEHVVVAAFARGSAGRSPRRKATLQARHGQLRAGREPGMFSVQPPAENVCDAAKAVDVFSFPEADSASSYKTTNMGGGGVGWAVGGVT